jgi:hypothetical protein
MNTYHQGSAPPQQTVATQAYPITVHLLQALNPCQAVDRALWTRAITAGGFYRLQEGLTPNAEWKHNNSASDFQELIAHHVEANTLLNFSYENLSTHVDFLELERFSPINIEGINVKIQGVRTSLLINQSLSVLLIVSLKVISEQKLTAASLRGLFEMGDTVRTDTGILQYLHETHGKYLLDRIHHKLEELNGCTPFTRIRYDFGLKKVHSFVVIPPESYSKGLEDEILSLDYSRKETSDLYGETVWVGWSFSVARISKSSHEAAVLSAFIVCQGFWFFLMHVMGQIKYHSRHLLEERKDAVKLGALRQDLEAMRFLLNDCQAAITRIMKYSSTATQNAMVLVDSSWGLVSSFQDTEKRLLALCERTFSLIDDFKSEISEKQSKAIYVIAITQVLLVLSLVADYTALNLSEENPDNLICYVELYSFANKIGITPSLFNNLLVLFLAVAALVLALYGFGLISFERKKRR